MVVSACGLHDHKFVGAVGMCPGLYCGVPRFHSAPYGRSGSLFLDEEMHLAEEKLEESKKLAETAMYNVLENDVSSSSSLGSMDL